MVTVNPIRSEEDLEAALRRLGEIFQADAGTPEGDERDVLCDLIEIYEDRHHHIGPPDPISAIAFRMDQSGLTRRDLEPHMGSRAKVSEVMSGRRAITMSMARSLHRHLGIPADALLQDPRAPLDDAPDGTEWRRFPIKAMAKLGWVPNEPDPVDNAEEIMRGLIERAVGRGASAASVLRRNDHPRISAKSDEYALTAWCWKVLASAVDRAPAATYRTGTVTPDFLGDVARLSRREGGPRLAVELLAMHGIAVEIVPHLPRTHLDSAVLRLGDRRPVVGLTLRHDRIDSFWYCLMHELAHVGLHLDTGAKDCFVHDHSLRGKEAPLGGSMESEADEWAEEALIPRSAWDASEVSRNPSGMSTMALALDLGIHPAIVAGRVRYRLGNYRLLSQFVGSGQIRQSLEPAR